MKSPLEPTLEASFAAADSVESSPSSDAAVWRLRYLGDRTLWRRLAAFRMDAFSSVAHLERAANSLLEAVRAFFIIEKRVVLHMHDALGQG